MHNSQTLIAKWKPGADPAVEVPSNIQWTDGRPATLQDYINHLDDTHEISQDEDGALVRVSHLGLSAQVRFEPTIKRWVCQAPELYEVLDELMPDASDEEIVAELSTHLVFYHPVIIREMETKGVRDMSRYCG